MMGLGPRKRWGQNFLINKGAREKLLRILGDPGERELWEIGPGLGAMTHMILPKGYKLKVFEIDPGYVEYLNMVFGEYENFSIVKGDVIKTWKEFQPEKENYPLIIGNLPYNAASAIIGDFIENEFYPPKMVFTIQKEMGQRMTAVPGTKNYSSFSVLCQFAYEIKFVGTLNPGSFYPVPRVSSAIIEMKLRSHIKDVTDRKQFFRLVRSLFSSRRKTIRNNFLNSIFNEEFGWDKISTILESLDIKEGVRAETLTVSQFIDISNQISLLQKLNQ